MTGFPKWDWLNCELSAVYQTKRQHFVYICAQFGIKIFNYCPKLIIQQCYKRINKNWMQQTHTHTHIHIRTEEYKKKDRKTEDGKKIGKMNEWMNGLCIVQNISSVWNSFHLINSFAEQMFEWRFALFFLILCFSFECRSLSDFSSMNALYFVIACVVWLLFVWKIGKSVWENWRIEWHVISGVWCDIHFNIPNF